jgi:hypothetical protein
MGDSVLKWGKVVEMIYYSIVQHKKYNIDHYKIHSTHT